MKGRCTAVVAPTALLLTSCGLALDAGLASTTTTTNPVAVGGPVPQRPPLTAGLTTTTLFAEDVMEGQTLPSVPVTEPPAQVLVPRQRADAVLCETSAMLANLFSGYDMPGAEEVLVEVGRVVDQLDLVRDIVPPEHETSFSDLHEQLSAAKEAIEADEEQAVTILEDDYGWVASSGMVEDLAEWTGERCRSI